jgi:mRNA interferase RelE/StbE
MYTVKLTHQAEHDVTRLDPSVATCILDKVEWLALNADEIIHQRLKGEQWGKAYKLRVGDYRVIYQLDRRRRTITVLKIGHRREVYRE